MRKINNIILHCSATQEGQDIKAATIKRWHVVNNGWKDIGYHYVIDLDGTVEQGRPIYQVGAHCSGHNVGSIGICYIGGVDNKMKPKDTRTGVQKIAMFELVHRLLDQFNLTIDDVHCHNDYTNLKACPSFKRDTFVQEYKEYFK